MVVNNSTGKTGQTNLVYSFHDCETLIKNIRIAKTKHRVSGEVAFKSTFLFLWLLPSAVSKGSLHVQEATVILLLHLMQ